MAYYADYKASQFGLLVEANTYKWMNEQGITNFTSEELQKGELANQASKMSFEITLGEVAIGTAAKAKLPEIKSGKYSATKFGNSDKIVHSYTRDEIINSLDGVTQKSTEIANKIRDGKIKMNVLGDELFESYLGCSSDTMAMQVGNQIYVRSSSSSIFSDVVHEGTHAIDFINGVDERVIASWSGETSAYSAERLFQIEAGMPVQFMDEEDMMFYIWRNYTK